MTIEDDTYTLDIISIGLISGDSFVVGERVRMRGIIGQVKKITKGEHDCAVQVWCRLNPLGEVGKFANTCIFNTLVCGRTLTRRL
jgi:hypothetical protein